MTTNYINQTPEEFDENLDNVLNEYMHLCMFGANDEIRENMDELKRRVVKLKETANLIAAKFDNYCEETFEDYERIFQKRGRKTDDVSKPVEKMSAEELKRAFAKL